MKRFSSYIFRTPKSASSMASPDVTIVPDVTHKHRGVSLRRDSQQEPIIIDDLDEVDAGFTNLDVSSLSVLSM
jgi:hypothetical protein